MGDDELKLDLTGKKKKPRKPLVLEDEPPRANDATPQGDTEELILGPKKKKKQPKVTVLDGDQVPEEKSAAVVDGLGMLNLVDAKDAWPDYSYEELLEMVFGIMRERNPELAAGEKKKFIMKPPQVVFFHQRGIRSPTV